MSGTPWTFICAGCKLLAQSERRHSITCSDACRVKAHRNGSAKVLRDLALSHDVNVGTIVQAGAIQALRPDLADEIWAGRLTIAEAQADMNRAFLALLTRQVAGGAA